MEEGRCSEASTFMEGQVAQPQRTQVQEQKQFNEEGNGELRTRAMVPEQERLKEEEEEKGQEKHETQEKKQLEPQQSEAPPRAQQPQPTLEGLAALPPPLLPKQTTPQDVKVAAAGSEEDEEDDSAEWFVVPEETALAGDVGVWVIA